MRLKQQVSSQINHGNAQHDGKTYANLPFGGDLACHPATNHRTTHDAGNGDQKAPEKLLRQQMQMLAQKDRRAQDVQEHAIERNTAGQSQQQKTRVRAQLPVTSQQRRWMKMLALGGVQGFRQ